MTPADVIGRADLSGLQTYGGDCVNIAVALREVFGGQYVASYANLVDFEEGKPAHFAVRINGTLYDGGGRTSEEALRDRAHYGVRDQNWDDIIVTEIPTPDRRLHDPSRVESLVDEFKSARIQGNP